MRSQYRDAHTYTHIHTQTQIADDYFKLKKFNIHEITGQGQQVRDKTKAPKAESHFEGGRVVKDKEGDKSKSESKEDAGKAEEEKKGEEDK